jgi:PKD repeat protein
MIQRNNAFIILFFAISIYTSSGQSVNLRPVPGDNSIALDKLFFKYQLYRIDYGELKSVISSRGNEHLLRLQGSNVNWILQLFDHDVHSGDYLLKLGTDHGVQTLHRKPFNRSLTGYLKSEKGGKASFVIADHYLAGMVEQGGATYFIEPAYSLDHSLSADCILIYNTDDVIQHNNVECGFDLYRKNMNNITASISKSNIGDRSNCLETEVAISNDYTVFQKWGSQAEVENWNTTILTLMLDNFDNEFQKSIDFIQTASFVATTQSGDPWNGINDIFVQLDQHQSWGNSGGYGANFDIAINWTTKYKSGSGPVGLAWGLGFLCTNNSYVVCSDYGPGNNCVRQLQAHEVAHIFGAFHDAAGAPYIMAPKVNCSSDWSSASITAINNGLKTFSCLSSCGGDPPECDFYATPTEDCIAFNVKFTDLSAYNPTSWQWTFPGGIPSSSTIQNPTVQYKTYGKYDVTLTVSNAVGSSTVTFKEYIFANTKPIAGFTKSIKNRTVSFSNTSFYDGNYDWDFGDGQTSNETNPTHVYLNDGIYTVGLIAENTCGLSELKMKLSIITSPVAGFSADTSRFCVPMKVKYKNLSTKNSSSWVWEFPGGNPNNSAAFEPEVEYSTPGIYDVKLTAKNSLYSNSVQQTGFIKAQILPDVEYAYAVIGSTVYFSNQSKSGTDFSWDFGDGTGSMEISPVHHYNVEGDFQVKLISTSECGSDTAGKWIAVYLIPKVDFTSDTNVVCAYGNIQFKSKSSADVHSWSWQFDGGTPIISNEENPTVNYPHKGSYSVKLRVQNSNGENELIRQAYINVISTVRCPEFTYWKTENLIGKDNVEFMTEQDVNPVIYPNPINRSVRITGHSKSESVQLKIVDLLGNEMSSHLMQVTNGLYQEEFNLEELNPGTYWIYLNSPSDHFSKTIFISN